MKNFLNKILRFFIQIRDFFACMLQSTCVYSIKKFLCYVFSALAIYMVIAGKTEMYIETLGFIAVLLGIRAWQRGKVADEGQNNVNNNSDKG